MIRIFLTVVAVALATSVAADDMADRRVAAQSYIQSPTQQATIKQMLSADQMLALMRAQFPNIDEEELQAVAPIIAEEFDGVREVIEVTMVDTMVETFTLAEIKALDAFYRSPEGAAVMAKMPGYMQQTMIAMRPALQSAQRRIASRVQAQISGQ